MVLENDFVTMQAQVHFQEQNTVSIMEFSKVSAFLNQEWLVFQ